MVASVTQSATDSTEEEPTICTCCYSDSSSSQALTAQSQTFLRPDTPNNASGTGESGGFTQTGQEKE